LRCIVGVRKGDRLLFAKRDQLEKTLLLNPENEDAKKTLERLSLILRLKEKKS